MNEKGGLEGTAPGAPTRVAQATLRPRSELECERLIRLAYHKGIASATAYRGPGGGNGAIFLMLLDEEGVLMEVLPELQRAASGLPVSMVREELVHASPGDFLRGGVLDPEPFRAGSRQVGWVFAGGALGAGARLLVEATASHVAHFHALFPFGTMAVNVAGSFGIAIFGTLLFERFVEERERMFWVLGFLGSFTTFSSYTLQTVETWEISPFLGALYGGGSIILGLLATLLGLWLTRRLL